MWQLCKLGYTHEPRLVVAVVALTLLAAVPDALFALWLAVLGGALLAGDATLVFCDGRRDGGLGHPDLAARGAEHRLTRRFRDRVTIALETHVARLQASVVGLEHQERSDYLDRLAVLRNQVFVLDHMYMSLLSTVGWIVRVGVTVVLLAGISPWLILLVVFAVPPVLSSAWRPAVERAVEERYARHSRLAEHLVRPRHQRRGRQGGPGDRNRARSSGRAGAPSGTAGSPRWPAPAGSAPAHTPVAWAIFGAGYVAAVVYVAVGLAAGPAAVLLILAAGARLSAYVGATIGEIGFLRGIWMDGSRRLVWLENYAAAQHEQRRRRRTGSAQRGGIRLDSVSFSYPGHRPARPGRRQRDDPARHGGGGRRGERRRQVDAGQAAGEDVRADRRRDLRSTAPRWPGCRRPTGGSG